MGCNLGKALPNCTGQCRGAACRSRRNAADSNGPPLKWQRLPDLSLRGGRRPTWQSREGSYVFAGSTQLSGQVLRDSHVASLLGMTRQASAAVHQCLSAVECSPYWAVTTRKGHAASVRRQSRQRLRSDRRYIFLSSGGLCRDRRCGRNRPIHPDRYSVHHAGTQPGHSDSFPAACFSCCFFRVFPA